MPITRTLATVVILLLAVGAWLAASTRSTATVQILAAEMAQAPTAALTSMKAAPPDSLHWQRLDPRVLAAWQGPYWLRWRLTVPGHDADRVLRFSLRAASQLYWNGQPLPPNGIVGRTAGEEHPGLIDIVRVLPASTHNGPDELLAFASSHHQWPTPHTTDAWVDIAPIEEHSEHHLRPWLIAALAMGALMAACLYFLALQRGQARAPGVPHLLALCVVGLALPVIEAWRPLVGYAYPWHGPRLLLLLALHISAAVLLPAYLARRFGVRLSAASRIAYVALLLAAAALLPTFDSRGAAVLVQSLMASTGVLLRARAEREERWPIIVLLVTGALSMPVLGGAFLDGPYFLLLAVLMGYLLVRHAAHVHVLDRHNTRLREERAHLSLQLLQRGIQPHWLMNTLTCLQELIEQAPARASCLVEALAEQFDRLRDSSQHQCVPLQQELALCRNHLHIVGLALGQPMQLEVDADDLALLLPPGVLHAQIENALTHAGAMACAKQPFRLRVRTGQDHRLLELRSACGSAARRGQGTGTRYIEASLAAAFPGRWVFRQGRDGTDWCGRIELTCAS